MKQEIPIVEFDPKKIKWVTIPDSSNIAQIGFSKKTIYVAFHSGGFIFHYSPFTKKQFEDFQNAPSKGEWVHKNLRNSGDVKVLKSII